MGSTCWNSSLQALQKRCSIERSCRKSQRKTKVFYQLSNFPYSFSFDFLVEACGDFIEKTSLWSILSDMWQQEPKDRQIFTFHTLTYRPTFSDILPRYDALLLEVAIADIKGRYFWEKNFCKVSFVLKIPYLFL